MSKSLMLYLVHLCCVGFAFDVVRGWMVRQGI